MTVDERLADWLERTTPEPPHAVTVAEVALRVQHRRRPWLPLLAAACVVLVAAVTIVIASRSTKRDATPPAHRTTTHASPSPHPKTSTTPPSTQTQALPIRPWHARIVHTIAALGCPCDLSSDGTYLYTTDFGAGVNTIRRLDAATLRVAASYSTRHETARQFGFSDGHVWVAVEGLHKAFALGLDSRTMAPTVSLSSVPMHSGEAAYVAAAGTRIFLAVGRHITQFDSHSGAIAHQYLLPSEQLVNAIAARGNRLYVGTRYGAAGELASYNSDTAQRLGTITNFGVVSAITATDGGLWVTSSSGMSATVTFNGRQAEEGGGGVEPTVMVSGNTVWLSGTGPVECADPDTGSVRAHADTSRGKVTEFVTGLVMASDHLYASAVSATSNFRSIVELHPPAVCR